MRHARRLGDQQDRRLGIGVGTHDHRQHLAGWRLQGAGQVTVSEGRPRPCVHDRGAGGHRQVRSHTARFGQLGHQRHAVAVQRLHAREVRRRLGLSRQDVLHEALLAAHQLQRVAVRLLVSDRRLGDGAERLAAGAARAMRRPHLDRVRQLHEACRASPERVRARFGDALHAGRALEQVRPTQIAHEDEVAGDHADRLGRAAADIGDEIAHVLRGVARRVHGLEADVAHLEGVAVLQQRVRVGAHPA